MRCPSALDIRREHNPNLVLCHVILNGGEAGVRDRTTVGGFDAADGKCPKAYAICATAITALDCDLAGRTSPQFRNGKDNPRNSGPPADRRRVYKSSGTLYWRDTAGDALAETNLSGTGVNEYVFFAGRRVARIDLSANVYYYQAGQIGSVRAIVSSSGSLCFDADYTPYGYEMDHTSTCAQNYKFTGYERDTETGLDYAMNRYYNYRIRRFMNPDPSGIASASLENPQSLNRYAFVLNSPLMYMDPSGLCGSSSSGTPTVDYTDLWPGPCYMPSWGCMFVSAAGTGQGSQWAGEQCGVALKKGPCTNYVMADCGAGQVVTANNGGGGCQNVNGSYVCPTTVDKYNLMEKGKTNLRDFKVMCSTHVTIDQSTGQVQSHVDLFNPQPLPLPYPIDSPGIPVALHLIYDVIPDAIYRTTGMYLVPAGRSACQ